MRRLRERACDGYAKECARVYILSRERKLCKDKGAISTNHGGCSHDVRENCLAYKEGPRVDVDELAQLYGYGSDDCGVKRVTFESA